MSDEQAPQDDRTEDASPRRRKEYRERGEVAKSQDFAAAIMLAGSTVALAILFALLPGALRVAVHGSLGNLHNGESFLSAPTTWLSLAVTPTLWTLAPVFSVLVVAALGAHLSQTGFMWSPKAMEFKPQKFNVFSGLKRLLVSKDSAVQLLRTVGKLILLSGVTSAALSWQGTDLMRLSAFDPLTTAKTLGRSVLSILGSGAMAMLVVGGVDFLWQRHRMEQRMKMTKEEARREYKQDEGDPRLKGERRQRHRSLLDMNQMIQEVPRADVIITNPTHVAVALRYRREEGAPTVVAKGLDHQAQRIKAIAREHDVPLHENVPLARALHKQVEVGEPIPPLFYKAIAEVLAYVYKRSKRQG